MRSPRGLSQPTCSTTESNENTIPVLVSLLGYDDEMNTRLRRGGRKQAHTRRRQTADTRQRALPTAVTYNGLKPSVGKMMGLSTTCPVTTHAAANTVANAHRRRTPAVAVIAVTARAPRREPADSSLTHSLCHTMRMDAKTPRLRQLRTRHTITHTHTHTHHHHRQHVNGRCPGRARSGEGQRRDRHTTGAHSHENQGQEAAAHKLNTDHTETTKGRI